MLSKYRNNLINLANNVGKDAFNDGAEILPSVEYPSLQKRQAEHLEDEQEVFWAGNIDIGTPGQTFFVDFDSKSMSMLKLIDQCLNNIQPALQTCGSHPPTARPLHARTNTSTVPPTRLRASTMMVNSPFTTATAPPSLGPSIATPVSSPPTPRSPCAN